MSSVNKALIATQVRLFTGQAITSTSNLIISIKTRFISPVSNPKPSRCYAKSSEIFLKLLPLHDLKH